MAQLRGLRRQAKRLQGSEAEAPARDFPLIKSRILDNSSSKDWDEARSEWAFIDIYEETAEEFTDRCQLCNQPGLKVDFEIWNEDTQTSFLVGSRCIERFLLLEGSMTQEESNALFEAKKARMVATRGLQHLLPDILTLPTGWQVDAFRNTSKKILGPLDSKTIAPRTWKEYLRGLFGTAAPHPDKLTRIKLVLFDPRKVQVKKVNADQVPKHIGHWADTTRVKDTRVQTTLRRSRDDRPDRKKID